MPPMPQPRLPLRLVLLAAAAIGAVLLLGFLVATLNSLLEFYQRIEALPAWLRLPLFALGLLFTIRDRRQRPTQPPPLPRHAAG